MRREYPDAPIIGVGGVIFKEESVLLAKRAREPGKGQWSIPGGAVELGETLTDALIREIREEVSIRFEIRGLVRVLDRIFFDRNKRVRYHYVIADYWGLWLEGDPVPATDVSEARFFTTRHVSRMKIHRDLRETLLMAEEMRKKATI
ncbi:NUDIX hydrolase [Thermodesulfobacteriota bacterium]